MITQDAIAAAAKQHIENGSLPNFCPSVQSHSFCAGATWMQEQDQWIPVSERLPDLRQRVLCYRKPRPFVSGKMSSGDVLIGYLFEIAPGERDGYVDGPVIGDNYVPLRFGGTFWAFPAIESRTAVTHWRPLPESPKPATP